jgi:hypothetical protein
MTIKNGSADAGVSTRKAIVIGVAFFWSTLACGRKKSPRALEAEVR